MLWAQSATKDYIKAEHKLHSTSKLFVSQVTTPQVMFFFFIAYLYSAGTQHRNLHAAGWPILLCRPTQEPCVSHCQHRKNWETFGKNAGEWAGRVEINKKSLAVCVACMATDWPTPGFKGRTFKLCVVTRWDFNFWVRSFQLGGGGGRRERERERGAISD